MAAVYTRRYVARNSMVSLRHALLILALVGGCHSSERGPLVLAYSGDDIGREQAEIAAAEWRSTCGADVRLDPSGLPLVLTDDGIPPAADAYTMTNDGATEWIHVRPYAAYRIAFVHEMGHGLGLPHSPPGIVDVMQRDKAPYDSHVNARDCAALLVAGDHLHETDAGAP